MTDLAPPSILFFTKYSRKGASSRYRTLQYIPHLEGSGFRCTVSPLFDDSYLEYLYQTGQVSKSKVLLSFLHRFWMLLQCRKYDFLVIEKELFPYLPAVEVKILEWIGIPYALDYDDALFHQYDRHKLKLIRRLLGTKISSIMRSAVLVTAGNSYLADYALGAGSRRVEVLPTVVDLEHYSESTREKAEDRIFTIGWVGSPSTAVYLESIASALAEVCSEGKARVVLVGSGSFTLSDTPVETLSWSELTEVENIQQFDVGVMPLANDPWAHGKCGLKLLQYMACGLPVVASPVGVNKEIVDDCENGFLADTHDEWVHALTEIRDNYDLGSNMGGLGRVKVEENYSLQVTAPRLLDLLSSSAFESRARKKRGFD